jgi:hypothetical protein
LISTGYSKDNGFSSIAKFEENGEKIMKKITLSLVVVIVLSLMMGSIALAAEDVSGTSLLAALGGRLTYGEVIALGEEYFTIKTGHGDLFTFQVDEYTRFRMRDVEHPNFSTLQIGQFIMVAARSIEENLVARVVGITPEDFDPSLRFGERARGEVLEVDTDSSSFTLVKPSGEEMTFVVGEKTRFMGQASTLGDLGIGWVIGVVGSEREDGSYLATVLAAAEKPRRVRNVGLVTSVEEEAGTFSMVTRSDGDAIFSVDESTKYHSRENAIDALYDLQPDMVVIVIGRLQENGSYLATQIAAAPREDLAKFTVKAGGRVTSVGTDSFTIHTKGRDEMAFIVTGDTNFRSRGVEVHSIEDLQVGMIALVGADEAEGGENVARLVIAIKVPAE